MRFAILISGFDMDTFDHAREEGQALEPAVAHRLRGTLFALLPGEWQFATDYEQVFATRTRGRLRDDVAFELDEDHWTVQVEVTEGGRVVRHQEPIALGGFVLAILGLMAAAWITQSMWTLLLAPLPLIWMFAVMLVIPNPEKRTHETTVLALQIRDAVAACDGFEVVEAEA